MRDRLAGFILGFTVFATPLFGQNTDAAQARQHVFQVLSGPHLTPNDSIARLIHGGLWKTLAYREDDWDPKDAFVEEGVPDHYLFFEDGRMILRMYDPAVPGQYSPDVPGRFVIQPENAMLQIILDDFPDRVFQEMQVLYCSEAYLALRWDGLSVFFIRMRL
jgi:hypothetical protein